MTSLEDVRGIPVTGDTGRSTLLRNVATVQNGTVVAEYDRYNMDRMVTVTANIEDTDLGSAAAQVANALKELGNPPAKVNLAIRGQVEPMTALLTALRTGLLFAVVVIFLLLIANFQSIQLAFITIATVPAAVAGASLSLWLWGSTLNLESFMGAIMAVGVAVANAILLVTFAERSRLAGKSSGDAALGGAVSRLRPILMTSLAMIAGMLPMAIGFGESGGQTAPLGRAVIGGLAVATLAQHCWCCRVYSHSCVRTQAADHPRSIPTIRAGSSTIPESARDDCRRMLMQRISSSWTIRLATFGVAIAIGLGGYRFIAPELAKASAASPQPTAVQTVETIRPIRADIAHSFNTNGTLEAYETADLYPKVSGYLVEVRVDIGDHVKAGQLLALISLPETEKQLAQAEATVASKRANLALQEITLKRQEGLLKIQGTAQQTYDEATANASVAAADVDLAIATADQIRTMLAYTRIVAPFDGVVSRRQVNRGNFVQAATIGLTTPLFTVQRVDTIRVFCNVPESDVAGLRVGLGASIKPYGWEKPILGKVTRFEGRLDPADPQHADGNRCAQSRGAALSRDVRTSLAGNRASPQRADAAGFIRRNRARRKVYLRCGTGSNCASAHQRLG